VREVVPLYFRWEIHFLAAGLCAVWWGVVHFGFDWIPIPSDSEYFGLVILGTLCVPWWLFSGIGVLLGMTLIIPGIRSCPRSAVPFLVLGVAFTLLNWGGNTGDGRESPVVGMAIQLLQGPVAVACVFWATRRECRRRGLPVPGVKLLVWPGAGVALVSDLLQKSFGLVPLSDLVESGAGEGFIPFLSPVETIWLVFTYGSFLAYLAPLMVIARLLVNESKGSARGLSAASSR